MSDKKDEITDIDWEAIEDSGPGPVVNARPQTLRYTYDEVKQALKDAGGVQSIAAKRLGITRAAVSRWVRCYPELRELIQEYEGRVTDLAANNIIKGVKNGNLTASMFWLRTRARNEGWSERTEVVPEPAPVIAGELVDYSKVPLNELIAFDAELEGEGQDKPD
jgi:hypothetical protein